MEFDWMDDMLGNNDSTSDLSEAGSGFEDIDPKIEPGNFFQGRVSTEMPDQLFGSMVGTPENDAMYYHAQTYEDTCAIVAQEGILKEFNIEVTESELREYAYINGLYEPTTDVPGSGGTTMDDVGELLESFGVDVHRKYDADITDLISELTNGHKVIVGLDASEIWYPESSFDPTNWWRAELPDMGHAVWLTGIDVENGIVLMNDSGAPDGQMREVPIEDFLNAWEDTGNYYCATDYAPPGGVS